MEGWPSGLRQRFAKPWRFQRLVGSNPTPSALLLKLKNKNWLLFTNFIKNLPSKNQAFFNYNFKL